VARVANRRDDRRKPSWLSGAEEIPYPAHFIAIAGLQQVFRLAELNGDLLLGPPLHAAKHEGENVRPEHSEGLLCEYSLLQFACGARWAGS